MDFSQSNRQIRIDTPLGDDVLMLRGFSGMEGISIPFSFELDLASHSDIAYDEIIGQNVTISIDIAEDEKRYFNGIIANFSQHRSGIVEDLRSYSATLVPWVWLLSMTSDSRIFQEKAIPDIIEQIFSEKGFADYSFDLTGTYDPREYCVQYRETDFNFISRLMEQYGLFYYFRHEDGKHTMVIANNAQTHQDCENLAEARYHHISQGERIDEQVVTRFDKRQEIRIGKYTVKDFNFKTPQTDLLVETESIVQLGPGEREIYDYPAEYTTRGDGDTLAKIRMQAEERRITTITGESNCMAFASGYKFMLKDFPISAMSDEVYLLATINHSIAEEIGGSGEQTTAVYSNRFSCIPFDVPFRPPQVTPKPLIGGVQTAFVVGQAGEEIFTDDYGRVKVQFHWDREGQYDDKSSCWIRVAQPWGGNRWGAIFIPRVGYEVIVEFLEGDPDRPIIIGSVYNGTCGPPYTLPDEKTKSAIKSDASPGGGGFNEIRIEDKKGDEQLFIHAERNQDIRTKNERAEWVGSSSHMIVGGSQLEKVGGDKHLTVAKKSKELVEQEKHLHVKLDLKEKVDLNRHSTVGMNEDHKVGMSYAMDAGMAAHLKAGMNVVIEAGLSLTLKGPGGFININPGGVFIQGSMIYVNSGGAPGSGAGANPAEPEDPKAPREADRAEPGGRPPELVPPPPPVSPSPQAQALASASKEGKPFCPQ